MDAFPAALSGCFASPPTRSNGKVFEPNLEVIKQRLLRKGVVPTPKILHTLRKKEIQKYVRRNKKLNKRGDDLPLTEPQMRALEEDTLFRNATAEYRAVMAEVDGKREIRRELVGRPWKRLSGVDMVKLGTETDGFLEKKLKVEHLDELRKVLVERNGEILRWFIDDADVESFEVGEEESRAKGVNRRDSMERMSDDEKIQLLARRLGSTNLSIQDWKFSRLMKHSGLLFSEMCMLEIIKELGALRNWKQALSVVKWVYDQQEYKNCKSRFVFTKLLSVLGKERRHREALKIFSEMREDGQIYPDMAAYHSIAVTLGQAGLVKELIHIIECMRQKPSKKLRHMNRRNWDPCLDPDIIIYNAVLNACVPSRQWKGVSWVLQQMRLSGLRPTETTYGLAMEVMLKARKYDYVHKFFDKMQQGRLAPKAISYKVLVRTFWEQGKVDEAVAAVRDMERRGVIGTPGVYYELACCLCNNGRWLDATMEWHILEHAFNTCLESGEIPHLSLFTEMLCQTIIQQKFERVNPLLNGMAHASVKISESQWLSLLQRNEDRFGLDALQGLLTHLHRSSLVMEQPIPDLLRSLESLCERATPTRTSRLASSQYISTDYSTFQEKEEVVKNLAFPAKHCDVHVHLQETDKSVAYSLRLGNEKRECDSVLDMRSETLVTESLLDQLTDDICNPSSRVPLAADILRSWKDERRENAFNDTDDT